MFKDRCERNAPMEGASQWEQQMDKDFSTFNYAAYRRILPVLPNDYHAAGCWLPHC